MAIEYIQQFYIDAICNAEIHWRGKESTFEDYSSVNTNYFSETFITIHVPLLFIINSRMQQDLWQMLHTVHREPWKLILFWIPVI